MRSGDQAPELALDPRFDLVMFVHTRRSWLETDAETARMLREVGAHDVAASLLRSVSHQRGN